LRAPALSFAIGQFLLFRRRSFQAVGGFSSARATPADDLAIARRIREAGMRWSLVDGGNRVTCRMYHGFQDAFSGISKNLFAAFGYRIIPFLFVWSWLGFVFLAPPILLTMSFISTPIQDWVFLLNALAVLEAALLWLLVTIRFRFPLALILLYPFVISVAILIAIRSLALTLSGRASWKGRRLPRPSIRLW
jgi:chlorobactene glucosyltransferase